MKIYRAEDYASMSRKAADILSAQIILKPDSVLGLATGSTPLGIYAQLISRYEKGELDFSDVITVNLDEYVGLPADHEQSYRYYMRANFFDRVNIRPENAYVPDGTAADPEAECARYDGILRRYGPIDIQLLGLGHDGHIGFNEPDDAFPLNTHMVGLAPMTIEANARFFTSADEVPRQALTMGVKAIMQARCVLMAVSGEDKAEIVKTAFTGPVTARVPASVLQMHPNFILVGDAAALSLLPPEVTEL